MTQTHDLKTHPEPFQSVIIKEKIFEYRWNDRNFQVGDLLRLNEYDPVAIMYTGRVAIVKVLYILYGGKFGVPDEYCIMSIRHQWNSSLRYSSEYRTWRMQEACKQLLQQAGMIS